MDATAEEKRVLPLLELRARAVELSPENRRAWEHYLECRAVESWPEDPIVRRNAAIIRWELDWFERQWLRAPVMELSAMILAKPK